MRSRPVQTTGLKYSRRVPRLEHVLARYARCGLDRGTLNLSLLADASTPAAVLASMRADVSVSFPAVLALAALEHDSSGRKFPVRRWNPGPVFDHGVDLPTGALPSKICRSFRQFVK